MKKHLLTLILGISCSIGYSQYYTMPATGTLNISTCSGNLYDPGGTGNYANSQNSVITICPNTPMSAISLNIFEFATEQTFDGIQIYDGNSTASPSIGVFTGTNIPGIISASSANLSGCLTIRFFSDGSTVNSGFNAIISCISQCQTINAAIASTTPVQTAGAIKICPGSTVSLTGSGIFEASGTGATYSWNWGDGNTSTGITSSHVYNTPGIYVAYLTITDPANCKNNNHAYVVIQVAPLPVISTTATPNTICLGQSSNLNATVTNQTISLPCTPPVSGLTYLPDGNGTSYTTSIEIECYNNGQTITSASDIAGICLNMEHSYVGDLSINLICPNGNVANLLNYPNGGGNKYLGAAIDDLISGAGTGATYCFNSTATTLLVNGPTTQLGSPLAASINPGNYMPINPLSSLVGCELNGTWTIMVTDNLGQDDGYIFNWDLNLNIPTPPTSTFTTTTASSGWVSATGLTSTSTTAATVTPTTSGSNCYTYTATNNFGCTNTAQQCITVNTGTIPTINTPNLSVCNGLSASFTASLAGATSFSWTGPNGFTANTATINIANVTAAHAGVYTVTVVGPNGCGASATANLTIIPPITPTITSNSPLCVGATLNLNGPTYTGATYVWSGPAGFSSNIEDPSRPGLTAAHAGTYSLYIVQNGCTSTTANHTVTINPLPVVNAGTDRAICIGAPVTLSGSGATSYTWNNGVTNGTPFNPTTTQTYTVTGTNANGCINTDQVVVTVNPLPVVNAGTDQTICIGAPVTLSGSGATSYTWNNGVTNGTPFNPTTTQTYTVTGTNANGCINTDQVVVTVNPLPVVNAGTDQTICIGAPVTLSGSGATSYTWNNGVTNGTPFNPTTTQTYTVTGTNANGCINTDQVVVTVNPLPVVNAGTDQTICIGAPVTLSGSGATSYTWNNGVTNGTPFNPTTTQTYTVTGTNANGCINTDQVVVTVNPLPVVNAGTDQTICIGAPVTLSGSGATSYTWNNGVTNGTPFNPTTTQTYTVTGTNANGCINTDQVVVTVNPLPVVNAGTDQTICIGAPVTLSGSGATSYTWNNGVTNGTPFNPTTTQTYTVTGTNANGCINTDQVVVTVNPLPVVNAGTDQTICIGAPVTLSGSGATSYTWNNGVTNGTPFNPTTTQTYTVTGTNANGCINTDQVVVTVNPLPVVNAGTDQILCIGSSTSLNASGATSYVWDNGVTNGTPFNAFNTITYTVIGTDNNNCNDTDQVVVNIIANPVVDAGPDQTLCYGTQTSLSASGANTYVWDNGVTNGTPFNAFNTITYTVIGTAGTGCNDTDQVVVTVLANPIVNAGADQTLCYGTQTSLSGAGATSYVWDNGVTNGTPFNAFNTITYTVIGTAGTGCNDTDQVVVTVLANPIVNAGADQTLCYGTQTSLSGAGATSYVWDNGITNGTPFNAFNTITYTVIGTDNNNCNDTDQVVVNIIANPVVDAGPDQTLCYGTQTSLSASGANTYVWDNGVTNGTPFNAFNTITYTVIGTAGTGCNDTDQVVVTVLANPIVNAGADQTLCYGTQTSLSGAGATSYVWDNGVTNGTPFNAINTITYTVIGTDNNNCNDTDQVVVTVLANPIVDAGVDQSLCYGTQTSLSGSGATSYVWDNGVTNGTPFNAFNTITYTVIGTDNNNCNDTDQVVVNIIANPVVYAGPDQTLCYGTQTFLSASGANTYVWDNGVTNGTPFNAFNTITYTVIGTSGTGCNDTDQVVVTVLANPIVNAGADQTLCYGTQTSLSGAGANTYVWDNGVTNGTPFNAINTITYTVIGTDNNNCNDTDQVVVTVLANPIVDAGVDQSLCYGTQTSLSGSGATSYVWDNGVTNGTPFNAFNTITYTVIGTDNNNCNDTDQVVVNIIANPVVDAGPDQTLCYGTQTSLSASGANTYVWDNGVTNGTPFNAFNTITYTVIGTAGTGCNDTDQVVVTVLANPIVNAGVDQTLCYGTQTSLSGAGANTYVWDNGVTNGTPFNAFNTITYTVIGTDNNNCNDTDQVVVTVLANPIVNAGVDQSLCYGTQTSLNGSGATSYVWDNGITNGTLFNAINTITYTVIGTDNNNCNDTDQVVVTVLANPIVDAGVAQTVCYGNQVTLNGTGANTYVWDNGITQGVSFMPPYTQTYTVIGTDVNNCSDTTQVLVTVNINPIIDAGQDQTVCDGSQVSLNASGAVTYQWDNGITQGVPFTINTTTLYTVIGFDANNCSDTDQVSILVNAIPAAPIIQTSSAFCQGEMGQFATNTVAGASYFWTTPTGVNQNTQSFQIPNIPLNAQGTYQVYVVVNGCTSSTTTHPIVVNPTYQTAYSESICEGATYSFLGNTFSNAGNFTIPFQTINGCDSIITLQISLMTTPIPDFHVPNSESLGEGTVEVIDNSTNATSINYYTSNGVISSNPSFTLNFNTDGEITITQVATNGVCKDSISKTIIIKPEGQAYIPNSFTPNNDGINDIWKPIISYVKDYKLMVFDRWGELVYETDNIFDGWNGGWHNNDEKIVHQGTYVYKIAYKEQGGKSHTLMGQINLIQ